MTGNFTVPDIGSDILSLAEDVHNLARRLDEEHFFERQGSPALVNRARNIQASLQIEGNTLSLNQVEAVLDGESIDAPREEIIEIRNARDAYEQMENWDWEDPEDLNRAHRILMAGLLMEAGSFRHGAGGISRGGQILHVAPPADRVPFLLEELILFLHDLELSPLMKSCLFHYEFEFIHPYSDGNGRLGRLWQTLMLSRWMPLFRDLALEALVRDHIAEYYDALNAANRDVHSGVFMEFMLQLILLALKDAQRAQSCQAGSGSTGQSPV